MSPAVKDFPTIGKIGGEFSDHWKNPAKSFQPLEKSRNLPKGWRWVKLGDVCEFIRGVTFDTAEATYEPKPGHLSILRAGNISQALVLDADLVWVPADRVSNQQLLRLGDLVICMSSGSPAVVGKTASLTREWTGSVGAFCGIIRPRNPNMADWVGHWFQSDGFLHWRDEQARGANIQNLRFSQFIDLPMPLAPLPEQKRIAAILNEQMAEIERARKAAEERLATVTALPSALFRAVFPLSGQTLREGWQWVSIGDVADVQGGYAFKSEWFSQEGIRLLRNANVFQRYIAWDDVVHLPAERRAEFPDYELREGEIVLALDRPVVSGGLKVAMLTSKDVPALLLQRVGRFRIHKELDADFLFAFLQSSAFVAGITTHDFSLGVPHVSPSQVEAVLMPLPSVAEQHRIAVMLSERIAAVEGARRAADEELATINALPAALLRKAFAGEL